MNIIVPMAGLGKRLRPHTLTTPKPLLPIAGKPIVQRLIEDIARVIDEKIDEIAFVIGDFGKDVENQLIAIAESVGATGKIYYQLEALGTAHAILCAEQALHGKVVVAYADTLFRADFKLSDDKEGIIWVSKVENPAQFGVVKLSDDGSIEGFYEKPKEFVSNEAIIGKVFPHNEIGLSGTHGDKAATGPVDFGNKIRFSNHRTIHLSDRMCCGNG
jgi:glucose-1-phosphate thymidylyltransferase